MREEAFILQHRLDDVRLLALKPCPEGIDLQYCLQQIEGWQLARKKIPQWSSTEGIVYPPRISMEQCSSEATADYKRTQVKRLLSSSERTGMADLTGGYGVDFSYLSPLFDTSLYVEKMPHLCDIASQNFSTLRLKGVQVVCGCGEEVLRSNTHFSFVYLDPVRRDETGRKVVALADCTPDVTLLHERLMECADVVMIKLSPMLDIHQALSSLPCTREVHVVSVDGECKELLFVLNGVGTGVSYHCINITGQNEVFAITGNPPAPIVGDVVGQYLYEPNASILKAGVQDALCSRYPIQKLHAFSHLFTSDDLMADFPGRKFMVTGISDFNKRNLKALLGDTRKANLSIRNFPASVADLRKKLKLQEGGNTYLFATTICDERHVLIRCEKV